VAWSRYVYIVYMYVSLLPRRGSKIGAERDANPGSTGAFAKGTLHQNARRSIFPPVSLGVVCRRVAQNGSDTGRSEIIGLELSPAVSSMSGSAALVSST
jgi:hypothetical protein